MRRSWLGFTNPPGLFSVCVCLCMFSAVPNFRAIVSTPWIATCRVKRAAWSQSMGPKRRDDVSFLESRPNEGKENTIGRRK